MTSRYKLPVLLILGPLVLLIGLQSVNTQTKPSFNQKKLTKYLNTLESHHKIMGSVAIDSAGNIVYHHSTGFAGVVNGDTLQADEQTEYRIGSISKTFTAAMIFQLIEEGKLSLSTKLAKFYPKIPKADSITIKNLVHQRSGLYNFTDSTYLKYRFHKQSHKQMLNRFQTFKSQFSPGSKTQYSNTNYVLLGYILEDITGDSYAAQLKKRITEPLGLHHTYYGGPINPAKGEAESFKYSNGQWHQLPAVDMSIMGGAGGIVSNPHDLVRFIRALFSGKIVSEKSLQRMKQIQDGIGMGLMPYKFDKATAYGHEGGINGFVSQTAYFPKKDVAVAFTTNGLNYNPFDWMNGSLSIYFGKPFDIPSFKKKPTIELSQRQMQKYVGKYSSEKLPIDIHVFVKDSTLKAQATGQGSFPLTATNKTTLRFDLAGVVMKFDSLKEGKYQQFTLHQHRGDFVFKRK
jgi:CubicO group peptidase (beta-lactamase class C family)